MAVQQRQLPQDLVDAVESGEVTRDQLMRLIKFEAKELGLTFDEAVEHARNNTLPKNYLGSGIQSYVMMLDY